MGNRFGVVVMLLLDPADVPLHCAKLCKYMELEAAADILFIVFGVSFFLTRLVIYPYVVWSSHLEAASYMGTYGTAEWSAVVLLYILLVLQVYWMALILKVAAKLVMNGSAEDVRSDSEDEDNGNGECKKE